MKRIRTFFHSVSFSVLIACAAPTAISTIQSTYYDDKTDKTTFSNLPLGSMSLSGKWNKTSYNNVSNQQNFRDRDSVFSALAVNQASGYPFFKKGMSDDQLVNSLYKWDSEYWTQQVKAKCTVIKIDSINHYLVWRITTDTTRLKVDNLYLFGCQNKIIFSVMVDTKKWNLEQKIDFVQKVYNSKTVGQCCN